jgi:nucleoside-diphosphate-sugar epimerase
VVWGSGLPEREFIHVSDFSRVISMVHSMCENGDSSSIPQAMILSPGKAYSIAEVVDIIVDAMCFQGKVVFDKTKPDGILKKPTSNLVFSRRFPDFKWLDLKEGIRSSVNYFAENYPNVRK